jgi:hypothetical protein
MHNLNRKRIYLLAALAGVIVLSLYVWFINSGPWRSRGYTSDYYARQASAFRHGQIALEEAPDPALLALPNLYDPKARKGIPLLGDASVYEGKYYLYFGALPSLILAPFPVNPGDQFFAYLFIIGLFLIESLFFIAIFLRYFAVLPKWIVFIGVLFLGLTGPFTRMLAHPFIHEAAISGGQFFSMAGLYLAFLAFQSGPVQPAKLLWVGILWACAIATRSTQLVPVSFMVLVTVLFMYLEYRKSKQDRHFANSIVALIAPLALSGIILAWYNWVRFDSIFEFGLYYQLAAFDLQANYSSLFSRVYIVQNLYNYFLNPFTLKDTFPFAFPLPGSEKSIWAGHELPKLYAVEGRFAGLLYSTPFLVFCLASVIILVGRLIESLRQSAKHLEGFDPFNWLIASLFCSFVAGSIPTLLIFYVGFRYETEFITGLTLLALIGFCQLYALLRTTSAKSILALAGASLGAVSVLLNIALAFTGIRG